MLDSLDSFGVKTLISSIWLNYILQVVAKNLWVYLARPDLIIRRVAAYIVADVDCTLLCFTIHPTLHLHLTRWYRTNSGSCAGGMQKTSNRTLWQIRVLEVGLCPYGTARFEVGHAHRAYSCGETDVDTLVRSCTTVGTWYVSKHWGFHLQRYQFFST